MKLLLTQNKLIHQLHKTPQVISRLSGSFKSPQSGRKIKDFHKGISEIFHLSKLCSKRALNRFHVFISPKKLANNNQIINRTLYYSNKSKIKKINMYLCPTLLDHVTQKPVKIFQFQRESIRRCLIVPTRNVIKMNKPCKTG